MQNSPVLYIDTYLTDSKLHAKNPIFQDIFSELSDFRAIHPCYRERDKIDIFKYTLLSYSSISWRKVYINFECEDGSRVDEVSKFASSIFPEAIINTKRSSTAKLFFENLAKIDNINNSWVFFSPNNDHPIISNKMINFAEIISRAEECFRKIKRKNNPIFIECIGFSHYIEMINSIRWSDPLYGYNNRFNKIIYEDKRSLVIEPSIPILDSLSLYKLGDLLKLFSDEVDNQNKRVVRLEDLDIYNNCKNIKQLLYFEKYEICRHYDGYNHTRNYMSDYIDFDKCPPLFIPEGIFESSIEIAVKNCGIKVGRGSRMTNNKYFDIYLDSDPIPFFWQQRLTKKSLEELNKLDPSWRVKEISFKIQYSSKTINIIKSIKKYIFYLLKRIIKKIK
jgi:hypothetical protein